MVVTGYCLWAFDTSATGLSSAHHYIVPIRLSVVPVVVAVLFIMRSAEAGNGAAPDDCSPTTARPGAGRGVGRAAADRYLLMARERLTGWGRTTERRRGPLPRHGGGGRRGPGRLARGDRARTRAQLRRPGPGRRRRRAEQPRPRRDRRHRRDGPGEVGAGVSVDELLAVSIPQGWFVPVTPGTRQVTFGGAIAADVHGKNHHVDGTIGAHVRELRLVTPTGAVTVSPSQDPDLFWATVGGMGLTGVVTRVTIQMTRHQDDQVLMDTDRFDDLDSVMSAMAEGDARYRYSVSWVDCMTRGPHGPGDPHARRPRARRRRRRRVTRQPPGDGEGVVPLDGRAACSRAVSIRAFNEVWFRSAPRHEVAEAQPLSSFFHPLDGVRDWNRLYGRRGFVQYRSACPTPRARPSCARSSGCRVRGSRASSRCSSAWRGQPRAAVVPGPRLDARPGPPRRTRGAARRPRRARRARARGVGGASTSPRTPGSTRQGPRDVPAPGRFLAVKRRVDPESRMTSDLARRLALTGE